MPPFPDVKVAKTYIKAKAEKCSPTRQEMKCFIAGWENLFAKSPVESLKYFSKVLICLR